MYSYSDKNLKKFNDKIGKTLSKIIKLVGYYYTWKENSPMYDVENPEKTYGGVIAQDLIELFPNLVGNMEIDGEVFLTVDYNGLSITFMESIKELNDMLIKQKKINESLYNQIKANTNMINQINVILAAKNLPTPPLPPIVNVPIKNINPPKK